MLKQALSVAAAFAVSSAAPVCSTALAIGQQGCCSHHGGVCGCSGSRKKCCDGRLSLGCRC